MTESTATETAPETPEAETPATPVQKKLSQPVVQHMRKAGLIDNDEDQTALTILKRVNHAIFAVEPVGNIPALQTEFRKTLEEAGSDIAKLTEGGVGSPVFKIVDAYLAERQTHFEKSARELTTLPRPSLGSFEYSEVLKRAAEKAEKYKNEREAYARMPQLINETVAKYPQVFDQYYNIGEIAEKSGIVKGEPAAVREKIDDVMAEVAASRLFDIAPSVLSLGKDTLKNMRDYPEEYQTNIIYAAEDTALHTTGLERVNLFNTPNTTPELKQIRALNTLLSAHLHALTSHNRNTDGTPNPSTQALASNLAVIPELVHGYQMASASLTHSYFTDGTSGDDVKMQSLDGSFVDLAENRQIPLVNADEARRTAEKMVETSAVYLRGKFADKPELLTKIDSLVAAATGKSEGKSFAQGLTPPEATTFAADVAAQKAAAAGANRAA